MLFFSCLTLAACLVDEVQSLVHCQHFVLFTYMCITGKILVNWLLALEPAIFLRENLAPGINRRSW